MYSVYQKRQRLSMIVVCLMIVLGTSSLILHPGWVIAEGSRLRGRG